MEFNSLFIIILVTYAILLLDNLLYLIVCFLDSNQTIEGVYNVSSPVAKVRKNLDKELFSNPQQISIEPNNLLDGMQRIQYHDSQTSFVSQEQTF